MCLQFRNDQLDFTLDDIRKNQLGTQDFMINNFNHEKLQYMVFRLRRY